jgi:hypothetical protein
LHRSSSFVSSFYAAKTQTDSADFRQTLAVRAGLSSRQQTPVHLDPAHQPVVQVADAHPGTRVL